jgi:kinesin family protein 23
MKDITNARTSRYCLITQEADTDGELETKLYKGDVIPTTTGGAQVVFDDVECLTHMSPNRALSSPPPARKRKSDDRKTPNKKTDVGSRCSTGIEGHSSKKQRI